MNERILLIIATGGDHYANNTIKIFEFCSSVRLRWVILTIASPVTSKGSCWSEPPCTWYKVQLLLKISIYIHKCVLYRGNILVVWITMCETHSYITWRACASFPLSSLSRKVKQCFTPWIPLKCCTLLISMSYMYITKTLNISIMY